MDRGDGPLSVRGLLTSSVQPISARWRAARPGPLPKGGSCDLAIACHCRRPTGRLSRMAARSLMSIRAQLRAMWNARIRRVSRARLPHGEVVHAPVDPPGRSGPFGMCSLNLLSVSFRARSLRSYRSRSVVGLYFCATLDAVLVAPASGCYCRGAGRGRGGRAARGVSRTASDSRWRSSVPQQPPRIVSPCSSCRRIAASAHGSGSSDRT